MSGSAVFNLAHALYCHARTEPRRVALVVDARSYSYGDLASEAGRVARWLRAGFNAADGRSGPRVGIIAARSFETYAAILGTAWAGGTYIPLGAKPPAERLNVILKKVGADAVIADRVGAARLSELDPDTSAKLLASADIDVPKGTTRWNDLPRLSDFPSLAPVTPGHPAYVIFTSGTTGVPKGVAVSAGNVAHYLSSMRAIFHITPADRVAQFFEPTFDVSVSEMFITWSGGAALHVVPTTKVMAPGGFMASSEITFWMSVPSAISIMERTRQLGPGALPAMRVAIFGGEGFTIEAARKFQIAAPNARICNFYGPTEATIACLFQQFSEPPITTPGRGTFSIGLPFPGLQAAIVSPDGRSFLGDMEPGELAVTGPQVALGYFGDAQQTAERFVTLAHPKAGRSRWYLTGDMALRDAQGNFHCLGRIDNQVKVNGFRVELEEVEAHLRAVCRTDSVAAVAWPGQNGNASGIVAFVSGVTVDSPTVREKLRGRMPIYMLPTRVVTLDELPLSTNGKVDRKVLRSMLEQSGVKE